MDTLVIKKNNSVGVAIKKDKKNWVAYWQK